MTTAEPAQRERAVNPLKTLAESVRGWLWPQDGWLLIILLVVMIWSTIASILSVPVPWVSGISILAPMTAVALLIGYLVAQQRWIPNRYVHPVAIVAGLLFAAAQTAKAQGLTGINVVLGRVVQWVQDVIFLNRGNTDNAVFLVMLAFLTFVLVYYSVWLVLRGRNPWLAVLVNGAVLLINIGTSSDSLLQYFVIYMLAAILLVVRFTLVDSARIWKVRGVRFSPDLGWDFMQAGAIFAAVVLLLANILPSLPINAGLSAIVNDPTGALQRAEVRFQSIFGGVNGTKGVGRGGGSIFSNTLRLQGNANLLDLPVMTYTLGPGATGGEYLIGQTYDVYNGKSQWLLGPRQQVPHHPADVQAPSGASMNQVTYEITFEAPPDAGDTRIYAPGTEAAQFNVDSVTTLATPTGLGAAWESRQPIPEQQIFHATGYVSGATIDQLRAVPYPVDADPASGYAYDPAIIQRYVNPTDPIASEIVTLARQKAAGTTNMYDAAIAFEDYLRTFTYSTNNPEPPADQDATVWFLHTKRGFCTFFASAMALMGRSLGMPTRIATGYAAGEYDNIAHSWVVKGTAAHAWTQIYFGKYGWIDFEPTTTFSRPGRISTASGATPSTSPTRGPGDAAPTATARGKDPTGEIVTPTNGSSPLSNWLLYVAIVLLGLLVAMIVF
ncbi:MAG TPA: transglutaminaseTgpA domain-containing protein, partial [Ktedonobacterales bacterium]